jgi:DNA repair protein SbcD/Mre11
MRLVHFADVQLGFRRYQRQTPSGINQREADVALAFRKAIEKTIELQPDLVLVAGDVFHNIRPTNPAILHAYKQFSRLVEMLPDADIVMVAGNHDTPRLSETGYLLGLFSTLGIHVVIEQPRYISLRGGEVSVLAVPYGIRPRPKLEPAQARYNVLLIHDTVEGVFKRYDPVDERLAGDLTLAELAPERWSYVALGHYHVYHQVAPNAYYSGSLEYASPNIWGELDDERKKRIAGKGLIEHDLDTGAHHFHSVPTRRVIDLPAISGAGLAAADLTVAIQAAVDGCKGGIDDRIVRLVVRDVSRYVVRDLDHKAIREFSRRALQFIFDPRPPELNRTEASGAPGRRTSLTETVRAMLQQRELTPGIDRAALVDLGLHYLGEAEREASLAIGVQE